MSYELERSLILIQLTRRVGELPQEVCQRVKISSPLTGYLGRIKSNEWRNKFYFLRDLSI